MNNEQILLTNRMNEFTENLMHMTYDELCHARKIVEDVYLQHDNNDVHYGLGEYFRCQIDIIVNYALRKFNRDTYND